MKFLITATISLVASLAFSHGESVIYWPSVNGLSINNACATEDTFRSVKPVRTCTATKTIRYAESFQGEAGNVRRKLAPGEGLRRGEWLVEETVCTAYGKQDVEVSRMVSYTECAYVPVVGETYEPCTEFVTKTKKAGLTYRVEKITDWGSASEQTFFTYRIPMCNPDKK